MPAIPLLVLQCILIIAFAALMRKAVTRVGQPQVIGEMAAGFLLGPTGVLLLGVVSLGAYWKAATAMVFPPGSLDLINLVGSIAVCAYMCQIGLEEDPNQFKNGRKAVFTIGAFSMVIPFLIALVFGYGLHQYYDLQMAVTPFLLYFGICNAVTAFPVLARVIEDGGMKKTPAATAAMGSSAVIEACAWPAVAIVQALYRGEGNPAITIALGLVYTLAMFGFVKPVLAKYWKDETRMVRNVALVAAICIASSYATHIIGVHAVIGAFVAGLVVPRNISFAVERKVHKVIRFFLPVFFASAGLQFQLEAVGMSDVVVCLLIIAVASASKIGGTVLAAKYVGYTWRESWVIGWLMNAKGAMELVVLKIGLKSGFLNPLLYAEMAVMTLFTTILAGPMARRFHAIEEIEVPGKVPEDDPALARKAA